MVALGVGALFHALTRDRLRSVRSPHVPRPRPDQSRPLRLWPPAAAGEDRVRFCTDASFPYRRPMGCPGWICVNARPDPNPPATSPLSVLQDLIPVCRLSTPRQGEVGSFLKG